MPKEVEQKLKRSGKKKGFVRKRLKSYVYGTMNKLGLMKDKKSETRYKRSK